MRNLAACALLVSGLALGGCHSSDDPSLDSKTPLDKMSKEEWCGFYASYLARPNIPEPVRQTDLKRMRERGCAVS